MNDNRIKIDITYCGRIPYVETLLISKENIKEHVKQTLQVLNSRGSKWKFVTLKEHK